MKRKFVVIFSVMLLLCASVLGLVACKHNHEWNGAWENDATYHWHNCNKKGCDEAALISQGASAGFWPQVGKPQ